MRGRSYKCTYCGTDVLPGMRCSKCYMEPRKQSSWSYDNYPKRELTPWLMPPKNGVYCWAMLPKTHHRSARYKASYTHTQSERDQLSYAQDLVGRFVGHFSDAAGKSDDWVSTELNRWPRRGAQLYFD